MKGVVTAVIVAGVLAGCTGVSIVKQKEDERDGSPHEVSPMAQGEVGPRAAETLSFLDRLTSASSEDLARMSAARAAPHGSPRAVLRHALWLATPGHTGSDAAAARKALRPLAAPDSLLEPPVRALVRLQLRQLQQTVVLREGKTRLERENARLRKKLRALTDLEQQMGQDETAAGEGS